MKPIIKWLIPVVVLVAAIVFLFFISGCSFWGILLFVSSMIISAFYLLSLWKKHSPICAKVVQTVLITILILTLIASAFTLIPILRGPTNTSSESKYLILLGAGVRGDTPSEILQDRINYAYAYLSAHPDVVCIASGGRGDGENLSEAQCIYNHLTTMGIDGRRIWLEDRATSTIENFRFSMALIEEKTGAVPESVSVLSNEFHLYRASRMASDCGLQAHFISAPTENRLIRSSYTAREIFALWKYLIIGG